LAAVAQGEESSQLFATARPKGAGSAAAPAAAADSEEDEAWGARGGSPGLRSTGLSSLLSDGGADGAPQGLGQEGSRYEEEEGEDEF
jgi:hypothetical protein